MDKVSYFENGVLFSSYFDIKYRPSENKSNSDLDINCNSLLTYMALADVTRNQDEVDKLHEKFLEALSNCHSEEEVENFAKFMQEVSKKGGYAVDFYSRNIESITFDNINKAKEKLEHIKAEKKKPVSNFIDHGVESEYYDVTYRAGDSLSDLSIKCSSLLTYMALADITRAQEQIDKLYLHFCETLVLCKTQQDYKDLSAFMSIVAKKGGYAIEFKQRVQGMINEQGKKNAQQYMRDLERKKKASSEDLEDFKDQLRVATIHLGEIMTSPTKDDEEIASLLQQFNSLQASLYKFDGSVDKEFITECDEQLEGSIDYLKDLYRKLEEISEITNRM